MRLRWRRHPAQAYLLLLLPYWPVKIYGKTVVLWCFTAQCVVQRALSRLERLQRVLRTRRHLGVI